MIFGRILLHLVSLLVTELYTPTSPIQSLISWHFASPRSVSTPSSVQSSFCMPSTDEIIERERQFLLQTYHRYPLVLQRGKGVFLYDLDGKRYLDFVAGLGVNALGHAHPRIVKVIREQAARVIHLSNLYYNEFQGLLAEKLCQLSGLHRAFFSNSGTEAMEGAIKLARLAGHK